MKSIRSNLTQLVIIVGLISSFNLIRAQTSVKAVQSVSADDLNVMLQAVEATQPVAADLFPRASAYYSAQNPSWPPLPANTQNFDVWSLGNGAVLLNDLNFDYNASAQQAQSGMRMMGMESFDSENSLLSPSFVLPDYGTNLWVEITNVSSVAGLLLHNTQPGVQYEIQSLQTLSDTQWLSEGMVFGSEATDLTPAAVTVGNRTASLFMRAMSWADNLGLGIPDWWQLQYFGYVGIDPYGNPKGDGWNNLQKFQNGMNPNAYYTPPAPQLNVSYNSFNGIAAASWVPALAPVTGYTVERFDVYYGSVQTNVFTLSASTETLTNHMPVAYDTSWGDWWSQRNYSYYRVQAHYTTGDSAWSVQAYAFPDSFASISLVQGTQGAAYLAVACLPPGTAALRVARIDKWAENNRSDYSFDTYIDLPVSASTNGLYLLPTSITTSPADIYGNNSYRWQVQIVNNIGATNQPKAFDNSLDAYIFVSDGKFGMVSPYFDGRTQLKQNLIFQLRDANANNPIVLNTYLPPSGPFSTATYQPEYVAVNFFGIKNYNGIYGYNDDWPFFDAYLPFEDNYMYRNYVFNATNVDSGGNMITGIQEDDSQQDIFLELPPAYQFQIPSTSGTTVSPLLGTNETRWLCLNPMNLGSGGFCAGNIGITYQDMGDSLIWTLNSDAKNYWGLSFSSAKVFYLDDYTGNQQTAVLNLGDSLSTWTPGAVYMDAARPQFETKEYDFWQPYGFDNYTPPYFDLVPGTDGFATTNASRLMIRSVGDPSVRIAGYAKLAVTNGYPGVYAYLGQYFDKAYTMTNGVATTNTTGVLSPYGYFFATEPGPAALVTMLDVDTGERGTCTVYCVSMQVDKNHDGTMDLSFSGPDATSQASPMRFWINSGHCEPGKNGNLDTDLAVPPNSTNYSRGKITCQRDLENFARLWICGIPSLPPYQNYTVTMSMSASSGNPAVNLYWSCETNGGISYLTDTNIAAQQVAVSLAPYNGMSIGTVSNNCSFTFPDNTFAFGGTQHFLFEGAGIGSGQLTLTISQNGNTIAQTGVWLDLHDIKDFYERAVITNNTSGAISNWNSTVQEVQNQTATISDTDSNIVVFVHGFNVGPWDWLDDSDTVFKRLYWAGYHGKFTSVRWPAITISLSAVVNYGLDAFNRSELNAYKSGTALKTYLTQLHSRLPGRPLNLLAHSQGNAVVSEAIEQGAPFDTYILTQGALPESAYDVNAPTDASLLSYETSPSFTPEWQPMGYHGAYTNLINLPGRIVNYYNSQDPVLSWWVYDQKHFKPDSNYFYDGVITTFYGAPFHVVTDPQESRANVSRSRTFSIGQTGPESPHGVLQSAVDLNTQFNFNDAFPADHSAQWTWPIQTARPYYLQILKSINQ